MPPKKQEPKKLPDNVVEETSVVEPVVEEKEKVEVEAVKAAEKEQKLPTVEIKEEPDVEDGPQSPWMKVKELSDEHMTVEAINIIAHQRSQMILRFRVGSQVIPNIHVVERMHYNGNAKNPFVAR